MLMVHSRNNKGVGVAHKVISPKNQPQLSHTTMGQYWLSVKSFQIDLKCCYGIKKK